ncbi:MAG TPA: hypothetical protein VH012_02020 [Acidimicrobiales bacterium]|jgi:hypothetical protein|nr:hypothetical protein [Acidimicrobiales bacterium]
MSASTVWVQRTDLDRLRTWHLQGVPGETLCDRPTQAMKAMPKAEWRQVLNPCLNCQKSADATGAAAEFHDAVDDPGPSDLHAPDPGDTQPAERDGQPGKHARRD